MVFRILPVWVLLIVCTTVQYGQLIEITDTKKKQGFSEDRLERLDKRMHQFVDSGQLSGVQTAIMRRGELVHFDTYGMSDLDSKTELSDDSMWRIYSMTKPIVSVGLMMLYEQGLFNLNDDVATYIPAFSDMTVYSEEEGIQPAKNKIKIVDLLRHTSGLGYGWGGGYVDSLYNTENKWAMPTTGDFANWIATQPLYYEAGEGWRYSVSTDICGRLIEVLSGQDLDEYLREHIFTPLGMSDTYFEVPQSKAMRLVTNYTDRRGDNLTVIDHPKNSNYTKTVTHFSGGGGLVSTTADYLVFCQMLLNGGHAKSTRFLSRKTIDLMTSDHCKHIDRKGRLAGSGNGFGLGFSMINDLAATGALGSEGTYGWGGAAGTYFRIDPKEDLIFVLMIQLMPYDHLQARQVFQNMVYQALVD